MFQPKPSNKITLIIFLNIIMAILILGFSSLFAPFIFFLFFLSTGLLLTRKSRNGNYIFSLFYLIYSVFATSVYVYKITEGLEFVHAGDQIGFYIQSEQLGSYEHYWTLVLRCFKMVLVNWNGGSALIFGTISYVAKHFLDGNHFLLHLYAVSFATSFSLYFLYKILIKYFNSSLAKKYTIIFGFSSYLFYYSGFMLRDVFIALFYMIAIYIYHEEKLKTKTIIKLLLVALLTYSFRNENGIFIGIFIVFYIIKSKLSRKKILFYAFSVLLFISLLGVMITVFNQAQETFEIYDEYTSNRINNLDSGSLVKSLKKLPPVVEEISLISFKLISPFPFWSVLEGSIWNLIFVNLSIAGIFSYYINFFIVVALIFYRKKISITKSLKYLVFIAYLLLVLNIVNLDTRRMFYVYPIIYLFFLVLHSQIKKKREINQLLIFIYSLISIAYILLKY